MSSKQDIEGRLVRLELGGVIHIGKGAPPIEVLRRPGPRFAEGASAVDALLAERRDRR